MYDYLLQYGFDKDTQKYIQNIKDYLKSNNIEDKERKWLPHITVDLYNCKNQNEFIIETDAIAKNIKAFSLECNNLNDFDNKTLYIEPYDKERLLQIKDLFNKKLDKYRLEHRRKRVYKPHITLCTNEDINMSTYELARKKFCPFVANIEYIWIYKQDMRLIKEYKLLPLN